MPPNSNNTQLENAFIIAIEAHEGQKSFAGRPYVLHPIRVMEQMSTDEERCVALLHDVIEDSSISLDYLARWFSATVVAAVQALTKPDKVDYLDYVKNQVASNPLATKVKIADLKDNTRIERIPKMTDGALRRLRKYHQALQLLQKR